MRLLGEVREAIAKAEGAPMKGRADKHVATQLREAYAHEIAPKFMLALIK